MHAIEELRNRVTFLLRDLVAFKGSWKGSALGPNHHLGELVAVVVTTPGPPAHAAREELLLIFAALHVLSIEIAVRVQVTSHK